MQKFIMGDIIWGTFLLVFALIVLGLYRFFTRKNVEHRSWAGFILILLMLGALLGLIWTGLNSRLQEDYPYIYLTSILFFSIQCLASFLTYRNVKWGFLLLLFTLLVQIPVIHTSMISYRLQTLVSVNIANYPGKVWDIEPGSYIHFVYFDSNFIVRRDHIESIVGINCIPIAIGLICWKRKRQERDITLLGN